LGEVLQKFPPFFLTGSDVSSLFIRFYPWNSLTLRDISKITSLETQDFCPFPGRRGSWVHPPWFDSATFHVALGFSLLFCVYRIARYHPFPICSSFSRGVIPLFLFALTSGIGGSICHSSRGLLSFDVVCFSFLIPTPADILSSHFVVLMFSFSTFFYSSTLFCLLPGLPVFLPPSGDLSQALFTVGVRAYGSYFHLVAPPLPPAWGPTWRGWFPFFPFLGRRCFSPLAISPVLPPSPGFFF